MEITENTGSELNPRTISWLFSLTLLCLPSLSDEREMISVRGPDPFYIYLQLGNTPVLPASGRIFLHSANNH